MPESTPIPAPGGSSGSVQYRDSGGQFAGSSVITIYSGGFQILDEVGDYHYRVGNQSIYSLDAAYLATRKVDSGSGNAHGFADNTYFRRDGQSYNAFDAYCFCGGTGNDFGHITAFQSRLSFSAGAVENVLGAMYSLYSAPINGVGTISNLMHVCIVDPTNNGTITANYGVYIYEQTAGATNWGVYTAGATPNHFGGNVGIGTESFGTSAAKVLSIGAGTAPASSPADVVQLWVEDVGGPGQAELRVRDELGNVATLSPHDQDGPAAIYTEEPGIEAVVGYRNVYRGEIRWVNLELGKRIVETFEQYNARRGGEPGHKDLMVEARP